MVDGEMENMTLLYKIKQLVRMILRCIFSVVELLSTKLVMTFDNLGCKILSKPRRRISIGLLVKAVPVSMNIGKGQMGSNRFEQMLKLLSVFIKVVIATGHVYGINLLTNDSNIDVT